MSVTVSQTFLIYGDLTVLQSAGCVFLECPPIGVCLIWLFPLVRLKLQVLGGSATEGLCSSNHMTYLWGCQPWSPGQGNSVRWTSPLESYLPSFPHSTLRMVVTEHTQPTLRVIDYMEFFCRKMVSSLAFTYFSSFWDGAKVKDRDWYNIWEERKAFGPYLRFLFSSIVLGWFLMALILSLDVMGISETINFCPVEENTQSLLEYVVIRAQGKKNVWTQWSQRSQIKTRWHHAFVSNLKAKEIDNSHAIPVQCFPFPWQQPAH